MVSAADADLRVALGLLDVRHLTGDPNLTLRLRTTMLTHWRRTAREPVARAAQDGPPAARPDGGARARVGARPQGGRGRGPRRHRPQGAGRHLAGRRPARRARAEPDGAARRPRPAARGRRPRDRPGRAGAVVRARAPAGRRRCRAAQVHVRELGRRITHLSRLTWRRVDDVLARPAAVGARRPSLTPVAEGVALAANEIVLDRRARPAEDPALLLRAAAEAAERDVVLAPPTAARLARECGPLPDPWPPEARRPAGPAARLGSRAARHLGDARGDRGAVPVLPEWERIRLLPHASAIHRFTVDRHVVETCIEASALIRQVARPDVLMVAALLHDIGKGSLTEHSVAGEPIARAIATRMGFDADGGRAGRAAGALAPAARRDRHHPRPGRPVDREVLATRLGSARGARAAHRRSPRPTLAPLRRRRGRRGAPG